MKIPKTIPRVISVADREYAAKVLATRLDAAISSWEHLYHGKCMAERAPVLRDVILGQKSPEDLAELRASIAWHVMVELPSPTDPDLRWRDVYDLAAWMGLGALVDLVSQDGDFNPNTLSKIATVVCTFELAKTNPHVFHFHDRVDDPCFGNADGGRTARDELAISMIENIKGFLSQIGARMEP